ncbi:exodeoxyribonuclease VII small subunit [Virgibacillus halophilus]|uniref:Exodeoxyribonuclease 7 small subunit n=1 Tax=Tigheibacillus halophilus TaxID=361280 RepID=A0ABU5CAW3_9BACI|nr:exodeoxyribonuclease VII small subunit [Virgibacillus halophilus]
MESKEELSFEDAMKELESIVEKLEAGDVPLEQAITYYQKGMDLSKICNDKLSDVEEKMVRIINSQGETEPFEMQEEE